MTWILTTESKKLEVNACETVEQVIKSDDFKRIFTICLRELKDIDHNYYISIFEKILCLWEISWEEAKDLLALLENNDFEEIYSSYFNTKVTFKWNNELLSQFKENISLTEIKNYLQETISTLAIKSITDKATKWVDSIINNPLVKEIKIWKESFFMCEHIGKWKILLNSEGKQISPENEYFEDFDFEYYSLTAWILWKKVWWTITVFSYDWKIIWEYSKLDFWNINKKNKIIYNEAGGGYEQPDWYIVAEPLAERHWSVHPEKILLNVKWEQLNQVKSWSFDFSFFSDWFIISSGQSFFEKLGKKFLLDQLWNQISDFYDEVDFKYYHKTWFIIGCYYILWEQVLLDKNWKEVCPQWKIHYDEAKNKFYTKNRFGLKNYFNIQ
jgi:hypothetical protein